jgi:hypothetical protein
MGGTEAANGIIRAQLAEFWARIWARNFWRRFFLDNPTHPASPPRPYLAWIGNTDVFVLHSIHGTVVGFDSEGRPGLVKKM